MAATRTKNTTPNGNGRPVKAVPADHRICGRGRHLLRVAIRDGAVTVSTGADLAAFSPVLSRGYARRIDGDRYEATEYGRAFLLQIAQAH